VRLAGPAEGEHSAVDQEAEYYQTIEHEFVSQRGGPLIVSNADWLLMRRWRRAGIPLRVVLRGIRDALEAHARSFDRRRPVGSLRYCAHEVEAARERWHEALAHGEEGGTSLAAHLEGLARALDACVGLPPAAREALAQVVGELRSRALLRGAAAETEAWLAATETALLRQLTSAVPREVLGEIEAELEADLAPYRDRMPERVVGQIRAEGLARRLFAALRLPRLTLFHVG
jgi:hypothetical protein